MRWRVGQGQYVYVEFDEIKKETKNAFLCILEGEEIWIPKSQVADPADYEEGDKNVGMSITEWIAKQKGLEELS
jgi:hypothetical protein